jgi:hypothetical protein
VPEENGLNEFLFIALLRIATGGLVSTKRAGTRTLLDYLAALYLAACSDNKYFTS